MLVLSGIEFEHVGGELLLETRTEFKGVGADVLVNREEVERRRRCLSNLGRAEVYRDQALIV